MRQHRLGQGERLDSWKEIASFLGRTVRTVQRWEREEHLPVHRHVHQHGASVYAYSADLEAWRSVQSVRGAVLAGDRPADERAHIDYLRGCDAMRRRSPGGVLRAIEAFESSLAHDPDWAPAHAALAEAWVVMSVTEWCAPLTGFPKVRAAASAALALDSQSAAAHAALGIVSAFFDARWEQAARSFVRALALDPRSAITHYWYGLVLMNQGRFQDAGRELKSAAALDPGSSIVVANVGRPYLCSGDYATAARYFNLAREMQPDLWLADVFLGWALEAEGRFDDAISCFRSAAQTSSGTPVATTSLAHAYGRRGAVAEAEQLLRELEALAVSRFIPPVRVARAYVGLSRYQEAFRWLETARETRSLANNVYLRYDPAFRPLANDPRFQEALGSLNC